MNDKSKSKNAKVDLYAVFGRDPCSVGDWCTVGSAWVGGACSEGNACLQWQDQGDGTKKCVRMTPIWSGTSFNEWSRTPSSSAVVFTKYNLSLFDIHLRRIKV